MDLTAIMTKVLQEQQREMDSMKKEMESLKLTVGQLLEK